MTAPFAALIIERDPYTFADFPGLAQAWFQDAGGFLFVGLLAYLLVSITRPQAVPNSDPRVKGVPSLTLMCAAVATLLYAGYGLAMFFNFGPDLLNVKPPVDPTGYVKTVTPKFSLAGYSYDDIPFHARPLLIPPPPPKAGPRDIAPYPWQALLLTVGGLVSFAGAVSPLAGNILRLRFGRIWALAVLCMKEGLRNRMFIAFLIVLAALMFPLNWFIPPKVGSELRAAVTWVAPITAAPLVLLSVLLASYALPNDVKNQNIYTIVTKPVERFEIVLGRFLGYLVLLTGVVVVVGLFTLATILGSNPSEESKKETGTARVPTRGKLSFQSRKLDFVGTDVGREFNYRKYIGGSPTSSQRAVYTFREVPSSMRSAKQVPLEFSFDIYRLTKGEENKGVNIDVRVVTWQRDQVPPGDNEPTGEWKWGQMDPGSGGSRPTFQPDPAEDKYKADALALLRARIEELQNSNDEQVRKWVANTRSAITGPEDRAQSAAVKALDSVKPEDPGWPVVVELSKRYGFFQYRGKEVYDFHQDRIELPSGLFENAAQDAADGKTHQSGRPRVTVYIHCTSASQMLGMAEGDLYLLEPDQPFWWNHLKSMVGLWCWLVLAAGLGVTLSTYLDFVVTLIVSLFLIVIAFFDQFIAEMGQRQSGQAGPLMALEQLLQAKQSTALPEGTTLENAADKGDVVFAWANRRLLNVLPDVHAFEWTRYVAEGFNVPLDALVMNVVVLIAYLFPWFLMAYYLIRGREVAA